MTVAVRVPLGFRCGGGFARFDEGRDGEQAAANDSDVYFGAAHHGDQRRCPKGVGVVETGGGYYQADYTRESGSIVGDQPSSLAKLIADRTYSSPVRKIPITPIFRLGVSCKLQTIAMGKIKT